MRFGGCEVLVKVVHMHLGSREGLSRGNVEVSNDLVYAQVSSNVASLFAHAIETLCIVFALALLDALAFAEGPANVGIRFTDVLAGVAAAVFALWGGGTVAVTAV